MELKGINYTSALRQVRDGDAGYQATQALRAEVMTASIPVLERLQGIPLEAAGDLLPVNIYGVRDAVVQSIELRQSTIDWRATPSQGGAALLTLDVHSKAELVWEGRLSPAHGQALIDAGLAEFIDADLGDGSSLVQITHPKTVRVHFTATLAPDGQTMEELQFVTAGT